MEAIKQNNPKVYVGTWNKYNNGDLSGGWIELISCQTYSIFLDKCKKLHADEKDPELMIQDISDFPDGLDIVDWLDEQDFNDIVNELSNGLSNGCQIVDYSEKAIAVIGETKSIKDELKKLGGKFNPRLTCGPGWIFSKTKQNEVTELLGISKIEYAGKTDKSNKWIDNLNKFIKMENRDESYYHKHYIGAVKIDDKFYLLDKDSIENKFCFHDEGPDYEYYKTLYDEENLKKHFLFENTNKLKRLIDLLKSDEVVKLVSFATNQVSIEECDFWNKDKGNLSKESRSELIEALQWKLDQFEKRLNTYLKRYGVSKIRTWTYWANA